MRVLLLPAVAAASLFGADEYAGAVECGRCHAAEYKQQIATRHAGALRPIRESRLPDLLKGTLQERGGASLEYAAGTSGITVTGRSGSQTESAVLEWAFGAGAQGITPVGRFSGQEYFEHRISWYSRPARPALTLGHPARPSDSARAALGLAQSPDTIYRCFHCHATNVRRTASGPDLSAMTPGIQCERCHGPGLTHSRSPTRNNILNPGRYPAKSVVMVCAECHRSPDPSMLSQAPELDDPVTIRFQPVGFLASRCFQAGKNFSCLSCHNPHQDARPASDPAYSNVCRGCHQAKAPPKSRCRRTQKESCLPCHMQTSSPLPYLHFTDHRIRVY